MFVEGLLDLRFVVYVFLICTHFVVVLTIKKGTRYTYAVHVHVVLFCRTSYTSETSHRCSCCANCLENISAVQFSF